MRRTLPLFIVCRRPGCGQLRQVRRPSEQRAGGYCSQRCNGLAHANIRQGMRLGVARSAAARKRRVLARVAQLTPLEAFRLGYRTGLESKTRQIRRRYVLLKKPACRAPRAAERGPVFDDSSRR